MARLRTACKSGTFFNVIRASNTFSHDRKLSRKEMSWWIFASAGAGALTITVITVSYQAIKAAIANPVKSLRSE